jgi:hypothetical protein
VQAFRVHPGPQAGIPGLAGLAPFRLPLGVGRARRHLGWADRSPGRRPGTSTGATGPRRVRHWCYCQPGTGRPARPEDVAARRTGVADALREGRPGPMSAGDAGRAPAPGALSGSRSARVLLGGLMAATRAAHVRSAETGSSRKPAAAAGDRVAVAGGFSAHRAAGQHRTCQGTWPAMPGTSQPAYSRSD